MTQPSSVTDTPAGIERGSASAARLQGRWLALARVACLGVSLVALVIWVWGLPLC